MPRGIDAQHVDEREPRIARHRGARVCEPLRAPADRIGILRAVRRIRRRLDLRESERAHDPAMVFRDRAAAGDLARDPDERRHERLVGAEHDAGLLLGQPAPQLGLDRQRDRRKPDVDDQPRAAIAQRLPARHPARELRCEPIDQDHADVLGGRHAGAGRGRQHDRLARHRVVRDQGLDPAMAEVRDQPRGRAEDRGEHDRSHEPAARFGLHTRIIPDMVGG